MNTINTLNGVILASRDEVTEHAENTTVHLTEEERTTWNAKADASALSGKVDTGTFTAHETNPTVHVTQEEREKWNARTTKGVVTATQDGLDEHAENTAVHITEEERQRWNTTPELDSTGSMTLTGELKVNKTLTVSGRVILTNRVNLNGAVQMGSTSFFIGSALFESGVTLQNTLNVQGLSTLNKLAISNEQCNSFDVEEDRAIWKNAHFGYFRMEADDGSTREVTLELGNGNVNAKARLKKPSQMNSLTPLDVANIQEGDSRWVKFRTDMNDAQYGQAAASGELDATTLYITSDSGKVYFGSHALN